MKRINKVFAIFIILNIVYSQTALLCASEIKQETVELNIDEVSLLAIKNNFDIQIYNLDKNISEKELLKARAIYDTEIDASYKYNRDKLKKSTTILGSDATTTEQSIDITKKLPTGTVLSLGMAHQKETSDSSFATLGSYHESEASISVTQPLAKNALGIIDRNDIKITMLDIENTGYTSLNKIEDELGAAQKAYWNLLLAQKKLDLTKEMLESAKSLYETNKKNFEIGLVEPPEFYAVDANLKERQKDLLIAEDVLNAASNQIRFKLNLKNNLYIVPKDDFSNTPIVYGFEEVMQHALNNRRDYAADKNSIKAKDLYVAMKKNSMWPQIDLVGTLKRNGLDKDFTESIEEIGSKDYPEYTVEIKFSFPFENRSARAERSQKELEKAKALVNLKKTECLILVQAHDAFIHAKSTHDSAVLLEQVAELQHKKFLGEEDRFKKGRSDTDRLIRYQQDYLNSKLSYLESLYKHKSALIDLDLIMDTLLEEELL